MTNNSTFNFLLATCSMLLATTFYFLFSNPAFASVTDGTIDNTHKYAWGENIGWLNFGTAGGNVRVTDAGLTGYVWSENYGWINLSPGTSGVKNNSEGALSGFAWGENLGWIDFSGVIINDVGKFTGTASGVISGVINFDCTNCSVITSWRPASVRPEPPSAPMGGRRAPLLGLTDLERQTLFQGVIENIRQEAQRIAEAVAQIARIFPSRPSVGEIEQLEVPIEELVSKEAPLALRGKWYLLPREPIRKFVLAPLPREIKRLAQKFPELGETLSEVGITKITDVPKLKAVRLSLPGLTERVGLPTARIGLGGFAMPKGVPIAELPPEIKEEIPPEIVFARTQGELIDFNIALTLSEEGRAQQKISTIVGKPLQLVVRPDKPVESIRGYVVLRSGDQKHKTYNPKPENEDFQVSSFKFEDFTASLFFALPTFANEHNPVEVETLFVLQEFEYTDTDGDGIYTAEIYAPLVEGEYEIITVFNFEDPDLGMREIRLVTLVDPEGYIYTTLPAGRLRIAGAIVSIYSLNPEVKQYELWPAEEYQQENPQITDETGSYSFLTPPGTYYLKVEHPNYPVFQSETFVVKEGSGVHMNIELKSKFWWLNIIDWKTILLIAVILLLLYNFYRDRVREKLVRYQK